MAVEKALKELSNVTSAEVDLAKNEAVVTGSVEYYLLTLPITATSPHLGTICISPQYEFFKIILVFNLTKHILPQVHG